MPSSSSVSSSAADEISDRYAPAHRDLRYRHWYWYTRSVVPPLQPPQLGTIGDIDSPTLRHVVAAEAPSLHHRWHHSFGTVQGYAREGRGTMHGCPPGHGTGTPGT